MAGFDFKKLNYFAVVGNEEYISNLRLNYSLEKSTNRIKSIEYFDNLTDETKKAVNYLSLQCNDLSSVRSLSGFCNLQLLRLEGNQITTLVGLERMDNLTILMANGNKLGINELRLGKDDNDDGLDDGKNQDNDSVAALFGKTSLKGLHLENNDIIWIDYISNLKLDDLFLANCKKLDVGAVSSISKVYFGCSTAHRSIDSNYLQYLQSEDILVYKNLSQDSVSQLAALENMTIEDCKKVKSLNISGSTLDNTKLNSIISKFPNLICLSVDNCVKLSTLDFTMKTTQLEQICFLNTAIVGNEVGKFDTYTKKLKSYRCNNPNIDISAMQGVLGRATSYQGRYSLADGYLGNGLFSAELVKKIEDCDNLTYLYDFSMQNDKFVPGNDSTRISVDLGKCEKLKTVVLESAYGNGVDWIISTHDFTSVTWYGNKAKITINGDIKIDELCVTAMGSWSDGFHCVFPNNISQELPFEVGKLKINVYSATTNNNAFGIFESLKWLNFNELEIGEDIGKKGDLICDFENWSGNLLNLKGLSIPFGNIPDLNFLQNNTELKYLTLKSCKILDISGISNLTKLQEIDFTDNKITNLYSLLKLNLLSSVVLENNPLDEANLPEKNDLTGKYWTNIAILESLHPNNGGALTLLNLKGTKITDFGELNNLDWPGGRIGF